MPGQRPDALRSEDRRCDAGPSEDHFHSPSRTRTWTSDHERRGDAVCVSACGRSYDSNERAVYSGARAKLIDGPDGRISARDESQERDHLRLLEPRNCGASNPLWRSAGRAEFEGKWRLSRIPVHGTGARLTRQLKL